ncbi:alpha/beta hydrolase [Mycobacterium sp. CBMA293]|uniref:alpha/beta hydrolase n=1 Tax=unclassified Mycolicibacterium TaxID=2636767 RepID=UPI0012DD9DD6|nr:MULTISPECIES: alpha/beta hydrolase [unclassified Mycolicibacterium]MUL45827.1 alpha/beta hydrolase [Mycolicibacterium sp. CBMA 360]MUL60499.1 alpha/beta hydrolase [Mycolicibacterium sp. CBMA 335]MUL72314.1 alpha/beta hydrolase [Mycolicibacterium sp. CBMA 311]MUL95285.1 alpha/beta hydrolase [Mycolicibacterium sp. CBMA 230]MUM06895.1 esterase [Mycolicibacterium sp. CBMA 213]
MRLQLSSLIDPQLLAFVDDSRAFYARRPPGHGPTRLSELLAVRAAMPTPVECEPAPVVETVSAGGRSVFVRIHTPTNRLAAGVLLEIHTGGFYLGSAARSDVQNRRLVDTLGVAVVSVDYRLAPEHPWPAAPDDCETAALWLAENAEARFGTTRLVMSGFSAGSTLATVTLVRLRDRGIHAFGGAVVQCGTYDLSAQTPAGRLIADEYFLSAFAGDASDRTVPDISPIFADLEKLPPILMIIGAEDVLLGDNLAMAARLVAAGVEVDLRVYPASPHAFTAHATSMARAALAGIDGWLRDHVGARE